MNIVIDDYNINIKQPNVLNRLKTLEYYKTIPDLFLETYTDLDYESIDDILSNSHLTEVMIETIYKNLNIENEERFIKIVNNSLETLTSLDGVIMVFLERYYNYNATELIQMTPELLLSLFIFCLKTKEASYTIDLENLREILKSYFSEKTVDDFITNCCERISMQNQANFEKEMEELNNI